MNGTVASPTDRRSAPRTDPVLLADVLTPNIGYAGEQVFFSRKAIGWALRDYAWTSPDWVRAYVADHPDLSGLSRREALKHLSQPTDAPTT